MLGARGRPQSQKPMVRVRERPPAADGDEAGVAVFGENHGYICRSCSYPMGYYRANCVMGMRCFGGDYLAVKG